MMSDHRRSYWKTTAAATAVVVGSTTIAAWAVVWPAAPSLARLVAIGIAVAALPIALWALLVAAGGLIALHRDTLERNGVSYAAPRPRERRRGAIGLVVHAPVRAVLAPFRRRSPGRLGLLPGELVEVLSLEEIRRTLDDRGAFRGLVFMPEMVAACGRQFRVFRRVDKLHDWLTRTGLRRVYDTVLLEGLRCDGSGHGGCQSGCYMRWNEAWLRRVPNSARARPAPARAADSAPTPPSDLIQLAHRRAEDGSQLFVCQTTQLADGTTRLSFADPRHYIRDVLTGNIRLRPLVAGVSLAAFNSVQRWRQGSTFPTLALPNRTTSPHATLDLAPGELVRVRSKREIEETLTSGSRNRGLWFDVEMLRYCGGEFRVAARVDRLLDERAGTMRVITNPCIRLESVAATGEYLGFCAQNELIFWREIWLARVGAQPAESVGALSAHVVPQLLKE